MLVVVLATPALADPDDGPEAVIAMANATSHGVVVNWELVVGEADSFTVTRSQGGSEFTALATVSATDLSYVDASGALGDIYVVVANGANSTQSSNPTVAMMTIPCLFWTSSPPFVAVHTGCVPIPDCYAMEEHPPYVIIYTSCIPLEVYLRKPSLLS